MQLPRRFVQTNALFLLCALFAGEEVAWQGRLRRSSTVGDVAIHMPPGDPRILSGEGSPEDLFEGGCGREGALALLQRRVGGCVSAAPGG